MQAISLSSGPFDYCTATPLDYDFSVDEEPLWSRVAAVAERAIDWFESHLWKWTKECVKVSKNILKITVYTDERLEKRIGNLVVYLGLLSGIKLMLSFKGIYTDIGELKKCIHVDDVEGIVVKSVTLSAVPFEILSSILSLASTLHKLGAIRWISYFSVVALPLAVGLLCYDTVMGLYRLVMLSYEFHLMPGEIDNENFTDFKIYLEQKIGITEEERRKIEEEVQSKYETILYNTKNESHTAVHIPLHTEGRRRSSNPLLVLQQEAEKEVQRRITILKSGKINKMQRRTDKKVVDVMHYIKKHLEDNPADMHKAQLALSDMRKLSVRKIVLNSIESAFNLGELVMYGVELGFPTLVLPPIAFSMVKSCVSIGKAAYKAFGMKRGLSVWDDVKKFKTAQKKAKKK